MTRVHSKLGASSASRWMNCPGSVALCATVPGKVETRAMREGSAAHAVAEHCLRDDLRPSDFIGKPCPDEYADIICDKEMADAVTQYVNFCRAIEARSEKVWLEESFHLSQFDQDLFGFNDFGAFERRAGVLHVVDYKHGAGVRVLAPGNAQLKYYALGALMQVDRGVESVEVAIVQPRCDPENPVSRASYSPMDLLDFGDELAAAAAETRKPNAPLKPGSWCIFCDAKAVCPKLYEEACATAASDFADVGVPDDPATLSSEELGRRLDQSETLRLWLTAIEQFAHAEAMRGRIPAGRKLVLSSPHRAWAPGVDITEAQFCFDVEPEALEERKPISPSQLEKLVGKKAAQDFIKPRLAEKKPGYSLVKASHKKPAVDPPTEADFADLEPIGDFEE